MYDVDEGSVTKKLRYALYARKSSVDEGRQVRSIGDQVKDCERLANELGIKVAKPYIQENQSAKTPNRRPLFNQLIKDVKHKKYDGILCWHPDRLARNMIEAGQIIDMLDNGVLKDLRFVSHQFSNDANGKMLLGMLFVFSKHYSDDLSHKVTRGVKGNLEEGKSSGAPKHGYIRSSETSYYVPDPDTHQLIEKAWQMRSEGLTNASIVEFLDENGYKKKTKDGRIIKMSESSLSKMFQDPFYYGVLIQSHQEVDLRELYGFTPVTTQNIYNKVQEVSYSTSKGAYKVKKHKTFFPLRQFVVCSYCDKNMVVGKSQPEKKHLLPKLYFRCDNKSCPRITKGIKRSVRSKNVFDWVQNFLDSDFKAIASEYDRYSKLMDGHSDNERVRIKTLIRSKRGVLSGITSELEKRALALPNLKEDSRTYGTISVKIGELEAQYEDINDAILKLEEKITDRTKLKLNKEQFLNLVEKAPDKMKAGDPHQKDRIIRTIFLNLKIDDNTVVSYICKEPFASLLKLSEISSGRGDKT